MNRFIEQLAAKITREKKLPRAESLGESRHVEKGHAAPFST